jgi:hypothetical protein
LANFNRDFSAKTGAEFAEEEESFGMHREEKERVWRCRTFIAFVCVQKRRKAKELYADVKVCW